MLLTSAISKEKSDISLEELNVFTTITGKLRVNTSLSLQVIAGLLMCRTLTDVLLLNTSLTGHSGSVDV